MLHGMPNVEFQTLRQAGLNAIKKHRVAIFQPDQMVVWLA
jgi:hypothetical protein